MVHEQGLSSIQAHSKLIFIVDDDANIVELLSLAISDETPYRVTAVHDGFEALKIVKDIKPHLFILDYLLPGMNGLDLYDKLHAIEEVANVPTIMLSTNTPTNEIQKRNITGIRKPFSLDELLDTIETLLA